MKKAAELEREIQVVKEIIRVLKRCFWLHLENLEFTETLKVYKDIKICTKELNKLIADKKEELGATKEPANNVSESQNRSGKSFF